MATFHGYDPRYEPRSFDRFQQSMQMLAQTLEKKREHKRLQAQKEAEILAANPEQAIARGDDWVNRYGDKYPEYIPLIEAAKSHGETLANRRSAYDDYADEIARRQQMIDAAQAQVGMIPETIIEAQEVPIMQPNPVGLMGGPAPAMMPIDMEVQEVEVPNPRRQELEQELASLTGADPANSYWNSLSTQEQLNIAAGAAITGNPVPMTRDDMVRNLPKDALAAYFATLSPDIQNTEWGQMLVNPTTTANEMHKLQAETDADLKKRTEAFIAGLRRETQRQADERRAEERQKDRALTREEGQARRESSEKVAGMRASSTSSSSDRLKDTWYKDIAAEMDALIHDFNRRSEMGADVGEAPLVLSEDEIRGMARQAEKLATAAAKQTGKTPSPDRMKDMLRAAVQLRLKQLEEERQRITEKKKG